VLQLSLGLPCSLSSLGLLEQDVKKTKKVDSSAGAQPA
jgi:hypothetical protein